MRMNNILLSIDDGFSSRYFLRSNLTKNLLDTVDRIYVAVPNPSEYTKTDLEPDKRIQFLTQPLIKQNNSKKGKIVKYINLIQKFGMPHDQEFSATWVQRQIFDADPRYSQVKKRFLGLAIEVHRVFYPFRLFLKWLVYLLSGDDRYELILREAQINKVVLDGLTTLIPRNAYWITAAKKLGIETCTIITNWDHPTSRGHMALGADRYLVWGASMKEELVKYQDIVPNKIVEVGSVIFDMYADPSFIIPFNKINNLVQNQISNQYVLFITNSPYYPFNLDIIRYLRKRISPEIPLVVRLHPLYLDDIAKDEFTQHRRYSEQHQNVIYFFPKSSSGSFSADMSFSEMQLSASLVANCNLMVNLFSTMVLDGLINTKPIVNIAFDWEKHSPIPLMMSKAEHFIHIDRVTDAPNMYSVKSKDELSSTLTNLLQLSEQAALNGEGKDYILKECGVLDGYATNRIAKALC